MKILIACEFSGVVREAFRSLGREVNSCDLIPSEDNSEYHQIGDVLDIINTGWDLMIAHPPCTYLCNSGVRWLAPGGVINEARHQQMKLACDFFAALYFSPIPRIAIENPIMHKYARDYLASTWKIPTFTQSIQPWQHGHGEVKRTCLWLQNLPLLEPSQIVEGREPRVHYASPGKSRWKERSRTLTGVAKAMANQWGQLTP